VPKRLRPIETKRRIQSGVSDANPSSAVRDMPADCHDMAFSVTPLIGIAAWIPILGALFITRPLFFA
jgi:hypothetical protein